ncbi:prenylated flavin chaperone LpdD [Lachnospira pectinoschiza]|uniref:Prenylated flavin chaperone LpdD-like domain-containing protein n=1 Tax=Lachnospira pectinoschiza TaxID=28052 RepID=A0A1G9UL54_9FIRM|nr:hypothetical protein [Lachnospira pectinoschiza]SDM60631.1 hypothetical protein SAMN05216544_0808 [Lachnospira pectinoschiza]
MVRIIEKEASCLGDKIYLKAVLTSEGITVSLAGGHKAHIGAVAVCDPAGLVSLHAFPGHKEGVLAESFAKKIFENTRYPVVVSAGIHYDNISPKGIEKVLAACNSLLSKFLGELDIIS